MGMRARLNSLNELILDRAVPPGYGLKAHGIGDESDYKDWPCVNEKYT